MQTTINVKKRKVRLEPAINRWNFLCSTLDLRCAVENAVENAVVVVGSVSLSAIK